MRKVDSIADGRILSGEQALKYGLVDQLGNLQDAIALAGKLAGIEGEPAVVYPEKPGGRFLDILFEGAASMFTKQLLDREWYRLSYR